MGRLELLSCSIDLNYTSKWSQREPKSAVGKSIINKDGSSGRSIISLKTKMAIISDSLSSIDVSLFEIALNITKNGLKRT